jgi:hypothetical protein
VVQVDRVRHGRVACNPDVQPSFLLYFYNNLEKESRLFLQWYFCLALADDSLENRKPEMAPLCLLKIAHVNPEAWINPSHTVLFRQRMEERQESMGKRESSRQKGCGFSALDFTVDKIT